MTCRRAIEADLLALVHGEGDAALRAHVDGCADCTAELEVWRELDGLLQAGAAAPAMHPEPAALVALVDAPASLAPAARAEVERHVADCRTCADEVRGLRTFSAAALGTVGPAGHAGRDEAVAAGAVPAPHGSAAAPAMAEAARHADAGPAIAGARRGLGAVLWHPAFAYALVVALLVPLVRDQLPKLRYETRAVDARRDEPALPPAAPVEPQAAQRKDERRMERAPAPAPVAPPPAGAPPAVVAVPARPSVPEAVRQAPAPAARVATNERREEKMAAPRQAERPEADGGARGAVADATSGPRAAAAPPAPAGAPSVAGTAGAAPLTLAVEAGRPTIFGAEALGRPVLLRLTPPADFARGPLAITVRGRANSRELTSLAINDANAIAVAIPFDWLAPGDYVVTLQPVVNGLHPAGAPALLGFSVRAPTAR